MAQAIFMPDRVHQVRLAETCAAMEEQRIEGEPAAFGQGLRGIVGKLIGLADDEAVERVARVERGSLVDRSDRDAGPGLGRLDLGLRNRGGLDCGARGRVGGGFDDHVAHLGQHRTPRGTDLLGKMILDPGRHEGGRRGQAHLARIGIAGAKAQRLQPAVEDALATALAQARTDTVPGGFERKLARTETARVNHLLHAHLSLCRKRPY